LPINRSPIANWARLGVPDIGCRDSDRVIREEHDAELAHNGVKARVGERQGGRIGGLELDRFVRTKLSAGDFQHWWLEVGGDQTSFARQQIAQAARHDAGARCEF
jgi:hypothetical protein